MRNISSDIIFNKSEDELEKIGIYLLNENSNIIISIDANNRSLIFRTENNTYIMNVSENNTYIMNVSDDNGSLAIIKIKNYDKKQISYLPKGNSVCICVKDIGDE